MELTTEEIDVLCEAMEAWASAPITTGLLGEVFGMMVTKKEDIDEYMAKQQANHVTREIAVKMRKERSVLIQAKLLIEKQRIISGVLR